MTYNRYRNNTPQEFYKTIKHNGKLYTLHSIYDDIDNIEVNTLIPDEVFDILNEPDPSYNFNFDQDAEDIISLSDELTQLYNTGLFD